MQDLKITGEGRLFAMFPTPVGVFKDDDFQDRKDEILKMCNDERKNDTNGNLRSNRDGWQSTTDWFFREENKSFYDYIHKMIESLFYESFDHRGELSFTIHNCWININPPGAYNLSHTHPGCDYAGVLYVNLPINDNEEESAPIVLDSPNSHAHGITYNMYSERFVHSYGLYSEVEVYPSEGTILIFPSALRHLVETNRSTEERVSIAFNIAITNYGKLGKNYKRGKIKC